MRTLQVGTSLVVLAMLLAGCCPPPPVCPPPAPVAVAPPTAPTAAETPTPPSVAVVTGAYRDVAAKEAAAVTAPDATPEYVHAVHEADRAARRALAALEQQGRHPKPSTLNWARGAVHALSDVLAQPPGG